MAELPLPAGLCASTFPAKLWRLVNSPRVRSVRWDSRAQGLLIDRSLFERELLSPGNAQGPAPRPFRATRFRSFVRQLHRYGFRRVPGRAGSAAPGDAGAWLHYSNPCFRRDRPDLLLCVRRRSTPNRQRPAAGREGRRRPPPGSQQLPGARPLPDGQGRHARFRPLPTERPLLARRPPSGFHLLHRDRPLPTRWEGPSRFQELYGQRPPPAEQEVLQIPPSDLLGFCGEPLLPLAGAQPRSRFEDLYGERLPPVDRELLRMQPCSFQPLHREQQPPASVPQAASGTSAPSAPPGSAAASTASSSAQKAPGEEQLPPVDLGFAIEQMIREIRRSLSERSPSAQGNINVVPESSEGEPVDRAAAEETPSGTESCGNSSPEPEEPDPV
uniref:Basic salivary proline-rich protein 4-like n=1 Tax=Taeniopygia guttata TaxID=59729 RepID=A0A674GDP0_TAEGU